MRRCFTRKKDKKLNFQAHRPDATLVDASCLRLYSNLTSIASDLYRVSEKYRNTSISFEWINMSIIYTSTKPITIFHMFLTRMTFYSTSEWGYAQMKQLTILSKHTLSSNHYILCRPLQFISTPHNYLILYFSDIISTANNTGCSYNRFIYDHTHLQY